MFCLIHLINTFLFKILLNKMITNLILLSVFKIILQNSLQIQAQDLKTWQHELFFNNPKNWKNGNIPCSNLRQYFLDSNPLLMISEMVLPSNGVLISPTNVVINYDSNKKENCNNKEAEFVPPDYFWYDPDNWNITSNRAFPRKASVRNIAVPHANQVPCIKDEAWFPADPAFRVHVIYPTTKISALVIGDRRYSQEDFDELIRTTTGKFVFPDFPRIEITKSYCTDVTGCICGNEHNDVLPTICKFKIPYPELDCSDPITPVGHCYPICGAKLVAKYNSNFTMEQFMRLYYHIFNDVQFSEVHSFTSKISEDTIQSVFIDTVKERNMAHTVCQYIYVFLTERGDPKRLYGISSVDIEFSKLWTYPDYDMDLTHTDDPRSNLSSGTIAAIISTIVVVVILLIVFYIYKKQQFSRISFARFGRRGDPHEMEISTSSHDMEIGSTPHEVLESQESPHLSTKPEENIPFDNLTSGTSAIKDCAESEALIEERELIENPKFTIYKDAE